MPFFPALRLRIDLFSLDALPRPSQIMNQFLTIELEVVPHCLNEFVRTKPFSTALSTSVSLPVSIARERHAANNAAEDKDAPPMPITAKGLPALQTISLPPSRLKLNHFSLLIYGDPTTEIADLLPSIRDHGILVALVVAPGHGTTPGKLSLGTGDWLVLKPLV